MQKKLISHLYICTNLVYNPLLKQVLLNIIAPSRFTHCQENACVNLQGPIIINRLKSLSTIFCSSMKKTVVEYDVLQDMYERTIADYDILQDIRKKIAGRKSNKKYTCSVVLTALLFHWNSKNISNSFPRIGYFALII